MEEVLTIKERNGTEIHDFEDLTWHTSWKRLNMAYIMEKT